MDPVFQEYQKLAELAVKIHKQRRSDTRLSDTIAELALLELFTSKAPGEGPFANAPRPFISSMLNNPFSKADGSDSASAALEPSARQAREHAVAHNVMFFPVGEQPGAMRGISTNVPLAAGRDTSAAQNQSASVEPAGTIPTVAQPPGLQFSPEANAFVPASASVVACAVAQVPNAVNDARMQTHEPNAVESEPVKAVEPVIGPSFSDSGVQQQANPDHRCEQAPAAIVSPCVSTAVTALEPQEENQEAGHGSAMDPQSEADSGDVVQAVVVGQADSLVHTDGSSARAAANVGYANTEQVPATGKAVLSPKEAERGPVADESVAASTQEMRKGGALQVDATIPEKECATVEDSSLLACSVHSIARPTKELHPRATAEDPSIAVAAFLSALPAAVDSTAGSEDASTAVKSDGTGVQGAGHSGTAGPSERAADGRVNVPKDVEASEHIEAQTATSAKSSKLGIVKSVVEDFKSTIAGAADVEVEPAEAVDQKSQSPAALTVDKTLDVRLPTSKVRKQGKRSAGAADKTTVDAQDAQPQTASGWRSQRKKRKVSYAA